MLDYQKIEEKAREYAPDIFRFLREIVAIQSFDGEEGNCIARIRQEMEAVGFDQTEIDGMGNLIGTIGCGSHLIAMEGHADTVGFGEITDWKFDPLVGYEDEKTIGGRGSADQKGGIASMVYAGKMIKELGLENDYTLKIVASVHEEDCEGRNWQYIIKDGGMKPEFVLLTEPTDNEVFNGQKGRLEIGIRTRGVSSHGSTPHLGVNAIYKMAPVIEDIKKLNETLPDDGIMGKGTVTISEVYSQSASRCAVADGCTIALDRRTNSLETNEAVLEQLRNLPSVKEQNAEVFLFRSDVPSWTGLEYPIDLSFPAFLTDEKEDIYQTLVNTFENFYHRQPVVKPMSCSTNGTAIAGIYHIPTMIYGPGDIALAHKSNEFTEKEMLVRACAIYAALPNAYLELLAGK